MYDQSISTPTDLVPIVFDTTAARPENCLVKRDSTDRLAVFLLGPPGAGKTTAARYLASAGSYEWIGIGELLRRFVHENLHTADGQRAATIYKNGSSIPLELLPDVLSPALANHGDTIPLIDGYPHNLAQFQFIQTLMDTDRRFQGSIVGGNFVASPELCVSRLSTRVECVNCHAPWTVPTQIVCSFCGSQILERRPSDASIDSIMTRYANSTCEIDELKRRFAETDGFHSIDASQSIRTVASRLKDIIEGTRSLLASRMNEEMAISTLVDEDIREDRIHAH